jgi:hypothetical protein
MMSGTASFVEMVDGVALYHERGELRLMDGTVLWAGQRYLYERIGDGFGVLFCETGMEFQRVKLEPGEDGAWVGSGEHLCGADHYRTEYRFGDGRLVVRHTVRGPRKDYVIRTVYAR